MKNILYKRTITWAANAPDGESPTILYLTEEVNFWAVTMDGYHHNHALLHIETHDKDKAIEKAVELGEWTEAELDEIVMRRP
jgi:hypothetical protein